MRGLRLIATCVPLLAVVGGCGSGITDVAPRSARTTAAVAVTPFCDAVEQSEIAAQPLSRFSAGARVSDADAVADRVRAANAQVGALAPQELRGDVDLVSAVVNRQLRILSDSGGDTLALQRDPDLARATSDPAYTAAARRITEYVRTTC